MLEYVLSGSRYKLQLAWRMLRVSGPYHHDGSRDHGACVIKSGLSRLRGPASDAQIITKL
jgi:hypothetical protein